MPDQRAEPRYQIAGEGKDLFTRIDLRDRIREGSIATGTEIAREGTEEYRPAGDYPELARYFSLLSSAPATAGASTLVAPSTGGPEGSVATRLIPGLVYPLTGLGSAIILFLAIVESFPFGAIVSAIVTPLVCLAVIRVSAEGSTRMPPLSAFGSPGEALMNLLKVLAITLLSAWPIILAVILTFVLPGAAASLFIVALIAVLLYYPACLAILAKWGTIRPALSVSQIWSFISTLGSDYVVALLSELIVVGLAIAAGLIAVMAGLPPALQGLAVALPIIWGTFYVFHLIGWAMYRHRAEL